MTTATKTKRTTAIGILATAMLFSAPLLAQEQEPTEPAEGAAQAQPDNGGALVDARLRMEELQTQLNTIRDEAVEENPELAERQNQLSERIMARMNEEGVEPDADMDRLREIAEELRGGELDQTEQAELAQEYRQTRQQLMEARQKVLSEEDIRRETTQLRDDLVDAMQDRDPETESLMNELQQAQQDLRQEMQRSGMGGNSGG